MLCATWACDSGGEGSEAATAGATESASTQNANTSAGGSSQTSNGSAESTGASTGEPPSGSTSPGTATTTTASTGEPPNDAPEDGLYTDLVDTVIVEIDYAEGAEPYTGDSPGFGDPWDVLANNLDTLFAENPKTMMIDRDLADMQNVGVLEGEDFPSSRLHELADMYRDQETTETTRAFYLIFVDGYFADDSGQRRGVLGVSVGQNVIGMFKPVVRSAGGLTPELLEQAVLVHEVGHAAGLVNAGVPLISAHQDEEHGKHCTNQDCVMYWTVDGSDDAIDFVLNNVTSSDATLWGSECLDDIYSADE